MTYTIDKPCFDIARAAFVAMIKKENSCRSTWSRISLKPHWAGKTEGFSEDCLQRRWLDFLAGWSASEMAQKQSICAKEK